MIPNPANPQSLNRYSYCLNNPLRYNDPSGHVGIGGGEPGDPPPIYGVPAPWMLPSYSWGQNNASQICWIKTIESTVNLYAWYAGTDDPIPQISPWIMTAIGQIEVASATGPAAGISYLETLINLFFSQKPFVAEELVSIHAAVCYEYASGNVWFSLTMETIVGSGGACGFKYKNMTATAGSTTKNLIPNGNSTFSTSFSTNGLFSPVSKPSINPLGIIWTRCNMTIDMRVAYIPGCAPEDVTFPNSNEPLGISINFQTGQIGAKLK